MARRTLDRGRVERDSAQARGAEAAAAAVEYLAVCVRNGVAPDGGPYSADDLARRAAALRGEG
ncbi:MAG: hypothetical protein F4059_03995 [Gemmatimonadetes bacterium]|nr:hypothetical protein [Gemmatimonadota bacterium]